MSEGPAISDAYTVTTAALLEASGLKSPVSLWEHRKLGNLGKPMKRPGSRWNFWTPSQANKFLRRIGKEHAF